MPPSRTSHRSPSPAPSLPTASPSSSSRRKGIPRRAPPRSAPYPPTASPSSSSTSTTTACAPAPPAAPLLLRLLLSRPSSELVNSRHKPLDLPSSSSGAGVNNGKKKKVLGVRDKLPPVEVGYGRGARARKERTHYEDDPAYGARGRSPGVKGKGKEGIYGGAARVASNGSQRRGVSVGMGSGAGGGHLSPSSASSYQYAYPQNGTVGEYLAVPGAGAAAAYNGGMARSSSLSSSPHTSAQSAANNQIPSSSSYAAVPNPSPLARSFSANGIATNDREARTRTPSGLSTMSAFDYSPTTAYVAA